MSSSNYAFIVLDSVDSTNNYAMAKVHAGLAKHGDAFFAMAQTGGKGQRGKNWHTGNGQNIAISIIIEPKPLQVAEQFKLSAAVALACHDFFSSYAGDETTVKWPNDIYWRDRKAGGVLIENVIGSNQLEGTVSKPAGKNKWKYAVVGVGININQAAFDKELKNVVSLKQITGKAFDVLDLAKQLHQKVLEKINAMKQADFNKIMTAYNACLFKRNCIVKLKRGSVEFDTIIKGVTPEGRLYTNDIIDNYFNFGEVEWLL
jgi:BirA family biotin operon repressor/biotin-[acetyl-CoA-carboxylase] ligase